MLYTKVQPQSFLSSGEEMFNIYWHGSQLVQWRATIWTNFLFAFLHINPLLKIQTGRRRPYLLMDQNRIRACTTRSIDKFRKNLNSDLRGDALVKDCNSGFGGVILLKRKRTDGLIVLGFNDTSTLVGHFLSSPREREKR